MFLLAMVSLATDGFGTVPDNPFSQDLRELISENLPSELIEPLNEYLAELIVPTIPVKKVVEESKIVLSDTTDELAEQLAEEMAATILEEQARATAAAMPAEAPTATPEITPSPFPTDIPTLIPTAIPTGVPSTGVFPPPAPSNQAPTCSGFNYSNTQTSGSWPISLSTLCNDADGDSWSISNLTSGANGTTSYSGQTISYDPNDGFAGTDNITFTIADVHGDTYSQAFDITISNVDPVAATDAASVVKNSSNNTINVLSNDTDAGNDTLTITAVSTPSNGSAAISGNTVIYTPNSNYLGKDSFTYTINDGNGGTATGIVNIVIKIPWCSTSVGGTADTLGCEISNIKLDGVAQTAITVSGPGATFTLEFDYQLWDTLCPGCQIQVMPGMESTFAGTCAYNGVPGAHPGASGSSGTLTLTAPSTSGDWAVFINSAWQTSCVPGSYLGYGEVIALITVPPPPIIMYSAGMRTGDLGNRVATDALCVSSNPTTYTNVRAFIGNSTADSIANMPANYGVPTSNPITSNSNISIADNWADLLDGNLATSPQSAGITTAPNGWWSGAQNADGTHTDGTTETCQNWTSASVSDGGAAGSVWASDSSWIIGTPNAACNQTLDLLCIAYP